jgi:hypothetical protein
LELLLPLASAPLPAAVLKLLSPNALAITPVAVLALVVPCHRLNCQTHCWSC